MLANREAPKSVPFTVAVASALRTSPLAWKLPLNGSFEKCTFETSWMRSPCPVHDARTVTVPPSAQAATVQVITWNDAKADALESLGLTDNEATPNPAVSEMKVNAPGETRLNLPMSMERVVSEGLVPSAFVIRLSTPMLMAG